MTDDTTSAPCARCRLPRSMHYQAAGMTFCDARKTLTYEPATPPSAPPADAEAGLRSLCKQCDIEKARELLRVYGLRGHDADGSDWITGIAAALRAEREAVWREVLERAWAYRVALDDERDAVCTRHVRAGDGCACLDSALGDILRATTPKPGDDR